jgi:hypothetical protein
MMIARMHRRRFLEVAIGSATLCAQKVSQGSSYSARGIRFEDRQKTCGVNFVLDNSTTPDKPLIDSTLGGVAPLDFDNDGFLDIFFINGARISRRRRARI